MLPHLPSDGQVLTLQTQILGVISVQSAKTTTDLGGDDISVLTQQTWENMKHKLAMN